MSRREHAMTLAAARDARRLGFRIVLRALLRDLVNGRAAGIQRLP